MTGGLTASTALSNVGRIRQHNEDVTFADDALGLYAVFDGMGGAAGGDVAAALARDIVIEHIRANVPAPTNGVSLEHIRRARECLGQAAQLATKAIFAAAVKRSERRGMGTTMVAALAVGGRRFVVCSVGDSRAYLVRDAGIQQITRDHTVVADLVERGIVAPADAANHPFANVLSRNLGAKESTTADLFEIELDPGDRLFLCSDGLTGYATPHAIEKAAKLPRRSDAVEGLVAAALAGGGGDNVSVIMIEIAARGAPSMTRIMQTLGPQVWEAAAVAFVRDLQRATAGHPAVRRAPRDMAGELAKAIATDVDDQRVAATMALLEGWLISAHAYGAPVEELVDYLSDASRIAEVVIEAQAFDPMARAMLLDAVLRCFAAANGQVATMLAHDLRALGDQLAAQQWRRRERSGSHSFADAQTQLWRTAVPVVEEGLSEEAKRVIAQLEARLAAAPRELRLYAHSMCEIAAGGDPALVAAQLYGDRQLERAAMAELWHRANQAFDLLGLMITNLRMRQTLPVPVFYGELGMALGVASYRLMRELATCALDAIAEVQQEYEQAESHARAPTKRPTLKLFALGGEGVIAE